ncbi:hypothetical protein FJZ31_19585 [Candidatus Poribacteria bacterium]|nr:hypothetical protein [Candidatus Poribacteria bacterium]
MQNNPGGPAKRDSATRNIQSSTTNEIQDIPEKEWVVHSLTENWKKSACLILFLLFIWCSIYWMFQSFFYVILSVVVLLGSLSSFFLPVRYTFYSDKVTIHFFLGKRSKPWSVFNNYYVDKNGVLLSPFPKPSRLDAFRGTYIRFGGNRAEIIDYIDRKFQKE